MDLGRGFEDGGREGLGVPPPLAWGSEGGELVRMKRGQLAQRPLGSNTGAGEDSSWGGAPFPEVAL